MASSPEQSTATIRQVLRLAAGRQSLLVPIDAVREILELGSLTQVPQAPALLRGVMNLRGAVVPIIDLAARCGLPPCQIGRRSAIVVVEVPGDEVQAQFVAGLLVDAVYEVIDAVVERIEPVPTLGVELPAAFLVGMLRLDSGYAAWLSLDQLLAPAQLSDLIGSASVAT
ncbi:MAG: purine-binding chemotaxis protein CheW [Burkholderiales bacterium]|nr:purine-binding chemotaxis protein CheW [Burkholderiales bacterium]